VLDNLINQRFERCLELIEVGLFDDIGLGPKS